MFEGTIAENIALNDPTADDKALLKQLILLVLMNLLWDYHKDMQRGLLSVEAI